MLQSGVNKPRIPRRFTNARVLKRHTPLCSADPRIIAVH